MVNVLHSFVIPQSVSRVLLDRQGALRQVSKTTPPCAVAVVSKVETNKKPIIIYFSTNLKNSSAHATGIENIIVMIVADVTITEKDEPRVAG